MVGVVQLVERQFVVLVVAGSSPVAHPIDNYWVTTLFNRMKRLWLNWIEHQTSDLRVRGSSPLRRTINRSVLLFIIIFRALIAQLDRASPF